jgi:hypothetical protein
MADRGSRRSLEHLAANPNTPVTMLNQLASHHLEDVRVAVAENRSTPLETLFVLARDQQPDVRYCLAENTNLPGEILATLCEDENPYVSARARRSLDIKAMLGRSNRFSSQTARLKVISEGGSACGEKYKQTSASIKRFLTTLTKLKALS